MCSKLSWGASAVGCGQNPARQASMKADIPKEVPSTTLNMLCGSGLKAVALGYQAIRSGDASVIVAGGQESMSQVCHHLSLPPSLGVKLAPSNSQWYNIFPTLSLPTAST